MPRDVAPPRIYTDAYIWLDDIGTSDLNLELPIVRVYKVSMTTDGSYGLILPLLHALFIEICIELQKVFDRVVQVEVGGL